MLLDFEDIAYPHSGIISRETPSPGLDPKMLGMPRYLEDSKGPKRLRSWPWNRTLPKPSQEIVPPSLGAQKTTGAAAGQRPRSGSPTADAISRTAPIRGRSPTQKPCTAGSPPNSPNGSTRCEAADVAADDDHDENEDDEIDLQEVIEIDGASWWDTMD